MRGDGRLRSLLRISDNVLARHDSATDTCRVYNCTEIDKYIQKNVQPGEIGGEDHRGFSGNTGTRTRFDDMKIFVGDSSYRRSPKDTRSRRGRKKKHKLNSRGILRDIRRQGTGESESP